MIAALALASACSAAPAELTLEVWTSWPGASVAEVDAGLARPLEQALARLPGGDRARTEIVPGASRTTFVLPAAAADQVNGALRKVPVPAGAAAPWALARPAEVTTLVITQGDPGALAAAAADLLGAGAQRWGPDKVWTTTDPTWVWTARAAAPLDLSSLPAGLPLEELLAADVGGSPLRARLLTDPAATLPDRRATWGGQPAALLHVAGNGSALRALIRERHPELGVEPWPEQGARAELWGPDAEAGAARVVQQAEAAGLRVAGVILGRGPLPIAGARRAEVILLGDGPETLGETPISRWTAATRGAFAEGGATAPPPGPEWDVRLDPTRLAAVGLSPEAAAEQLRWRTAGVSVPVEGGLLRLRIGDPPDSAEELAAQALELPYGPAPLASLAAIRRVEAARYLSRP